MQRSIDRREWLKGAAAVAAAFALPGPGLLASGQHRGKGIVRLDMNENPYGFSDRTARAIRDTLHRSSRYPRREREALRDLIATREGVPSNRILLGAGSTEVFTLAALLYGADDKEVLVADPSYPVFNQYMERLRGRLVQVPMTERWQADLEGMAARVGNRTRSPLDCRPQTTSARSSMDRALDYGSSGWEFDSLRARGGAPVHRPSGRSDRGSFAFRGR